MILKNITEDTQLIMKTTRKFDQISKTNGEIISRLLEIGKKKNYFELFFFFIVQKSFFFILLTLLQTFFADGSFCLFSL